MCGILVFLITPTTTWQFAAYPYTTGTQKAVKFLNISIIHFSARYTLSTPNQWMPLISFIYSQIHVTIIIIIWKSTFQIPIQSGGGPPWKALLPKWSFLGKIVNYHTPINGKAPPHVDKNQQHPTIPLFTIFQLSIMHSVCPQILHKLLLWNTLGRSAYSQEHSATIVYAKCGR